MSENKPVQLGAAWKRDSKKGEPYYSGVVDKAQGGGTSEEVANVLRAFAADPTAFRFLVFPNDKKGNTKAPDIRILLAPVSDGPKGMPKRTGSAKPTPPRSSSKADLF